MTNRSLLILLILGWGTALSAQAPDSLPNPYRQGRWLAGLAGTINSSNTNQGFRLPDTSNFANDHLIELRGGYFLTDRLPVGFFVSTRRQNSVEEFERASEILFIGGWARYYLLPDAASLYPEFSLFFVNFYNQIALSVDGVGRLNSVVRGNGIGGSLGLGFSYAFSDLLVFDIALKYNLYAISGQIEDRIAGTREDRNFTTGEVMFAFGFNVLIRK